MKKKVVCVCVIKIDPLRQLYSLFYAGITVLQINILNNRSNMTRTAVFSKPLLMRTHTLTQTVF